MEVVTSKVLPWEPIKIMPIGDIQFSGHNGPADIKRLRSYLEAGMEQGAYFIGMGDYCDWLSPSNRHRLTQAALYDTAQDVIERAAMQLEDELFEVLEPTKGRWLGLLEGHHFYTHSNGETTDQRLARLLDSRFLGTSCLYRITFRDKLATGSTRSIVFTIWAHHGAGGASSVSAVLLKLEKMVSAFDADLFLMGHAHRIGAAPLDYITVGSRGIPRMYHKTKLLVATGSFLRGWQQGSTVGGTPRGSYVEQRMLKPVALGGTVITATPKRLGHNCIHSLVDLRVSL